jgi:flavin reductase (DIM6/NTAB) family NADH-FMN oxidoreductase RutF
VSSNEAQQPAHEGLSDLARALGRIPTGLYVAATRTGGAPVGFVASLLVQTGFDPPTVALAVARARPHLAALRASQRFAVSILDAQSRGLMGAFFKAYPPGRGPFDQVENDAAPGGSPVLRGALAWLECEVSGEYDGGGDHVVLFARVTHGRVARPGDPAVHLRKNGLDY